MKMILKSKKTILAISSIAALISLSANYSYAQEVMPKRAIANVQINEEAGAEINLSILPAANNELQRVAQAPQDIKLGACPYPISYVMKAPNSPALNMPVLPSQILLSDFPNTPYVNNPTYPPTDLSHNPVFNQTSMNKYFGYTFFTPKQEGKCCQYNTGKLQVTYKALATSRPGQSSTNNDGSIVFYKDSSGTQKNIKPTQSPTTGHIWGNDMEGNTTAGQITTRDFVIPASAIAGGHISLFAQDDTAVVSATLTITGCCVKSSMESPK